MLEVERLLSYSKDFGFLKKKSLNEGLGGLNNQVSLHKDLPLSNPTWRTSKEPEPSRTKWV